MISLEVAWFGSWLGGRFMDYAARSRDGSIENSLFFMNCLYIAS